MKESTTSFIEATNDDVGATDEKSLVRKIDMHLMPTLWLMFFWSYIDRTNIGNAKIGGMEEDLHLTSGQYSLSLIVFLVTYILAEIPSNMLLSKTRPSVYLPFMMVLWGIVTSCMAAVQSYKHLLALRTVLGFLEASFNPGVYLILSSWYQKEEQSKRFAIYLSADIIAGAFGGLLAGSVISNLEGSRGIRGWRWLFIIEGVVSIIWAVASHFLLLDFPATSSKLTKDERALAVSRLKVDNNAVGRSPLKPVQALKSALSDRRVWLFALGYMPIAGASILIYFFPTLVAGLGYKGTKAQYMVVPIYAVAFICNGFSGYYCDKRPEQRGLVIASWLMLSTSCAIAVCAVYDFKARYVLLVFVAAGLWSANPISVSWASSTLGDKEQGVRAVALAFINAIGAASQLFGAYLFPAEDAPKYLTGFEVISALCAFGICIYTSLYLLLRRQAARV